MDRHVLDYIEIVDLCIHLGSNIENNGNCSYETRRIALAKTAA